MDAKSVWTCEWVWVCELNFRILSLLLPPLPLLLLWKRHTAEVHELWLLHRAAKYINRDGHKYMLYIHTNAEWHEVLSRSIYPFKYTLNTSHMIYYYTYTVYVCVCVFSLGLTGSISVPECHHPVEQRNKERKKKKSHQSWFFAISMMLWAEAFGISSVHVCMCVLEASLSMMPAFDFACVRALPTFASYDDGKLCASRHSRQ